MTDGKACENKSKVTPCTEDKFTLAEIEAAMGPALREQAELNEGVFERGLNQWEQKDVIRRTMQLLEGLRRN